MKAINAETFTHNLVAIRCERRKNIFLSQRYVRAYQKCESFVISYTYYHHIYVGTVCVCLSYCSNC